MNSLRTLVTPALVGTALLLVVSGCETARQPVQSVSPSPVSTESGNNLSFTFSDSSGKTKSINVPRRLPASTSRGYDLDGNFVSLGTLKGYAIEAFKTGATSREMEAKYRLNRFDGETIEIVVTALLRSGASSL